MAVIDVSSDYLSRKSEFLGTLVTINTLILGFSLSSLAVLSLDTSGSDSAVLRFGDVEHSLAFVAERLLSLIGIVAALGCFIAVLAYLGIARITKVQSCFRALSSNRDKAMVAGLLFRMSLIQKTNQKMATAITMAIVVASGTIIIILASVASGGGTNGAIEFNFDVFGFAIGVMAIVLLGAVFYLLVVFLFSNRSLKSGNGFCEGVFLIDSVRIDDHRLAFLGSYEHTIRLVEFGARIAVSAMEKLSKLDPEESTSAIKSEDSVDSLTALLIAQKWQSEWKIANATVSESGCWEITLHSSEVSGNEPVVIGFRVDKKSSSITVPDFYTIIAGRPPAVPEEF